jgi:hypothetical protein
LYFPRAGYGLVVYEYHSARNFEAREVLAAVIHDLIFGNRFTSFQLEENCHDFHQAIINHAHSDRLFYGVAFQKNPWRIGRPG